LAAILGSENLARALKDLEQVLGLQPQSPNMEDCKTPSSSSAGAADPLAKAAMTAEGANAAQIRSPSDTDVSMGATADSVISPAMACDDDSRSHVDLDQLLQLFLAHYQDLLQQYDWEPRTNSQCPGGTLTLEADDLDLKQTQDGSTCDPHNDHQAELCAMTAAAKQLVTELAGGYGFK
jgi:hypothetical protein